MALDPDVVAFRRWLIEKLKQSRWVVQSGEPIEKTALRLGVQPDMLVQAQSELDAESIEAGRVPVDLGSRTRHVRRVCKWIDLDFPKTVYDDWRAFCAARTVLSPTAWLRSVVHTLLSGPTKPTWTGRGWVYRGEPLWLEGYGSYTGANQRWPFHERCDITHGAMTALTWRAEDYGARATAVVRGAVADLLEGRMQRLTAAPGLNVMWDDPYRYWVHPDRRKER